MLLISEALKFIYTIVLHVEGWERVVAWYFFSFDQHSKSLLMIGRETSQIGHLEMDDKLLENECDTWHL